MRPRLENASEDRPHNALPEGANVGGYTIGAVLGRPGGFGITYFATNELHPSERFAIKEFFPRSLAVRRAGEAAVHPARPGEAAAFQTALQCFKEEALTLAKYQHPNIVGVRQFIAANGTAYLLMTYEEGLTLGDLLEQRGPLPLSFLVSLLPGLLGAIRAVHAGNFIHRDLKPSNIYIRSADHSPVLLDFGAAREALGEEGVTSFTEIRTPGYAPHEQYFRKGHQGEWTDIYALGATLYCCVTGRPPPEATERKESDSMEPAVVAARGRYPSALLAAIDAMLAVNKDDRPQTIDSVVSLMVPRSSRDTPTRDPAVRGSAASSDIQWMEDVRHGLAPLLISHSDAEGEINEFFDAAKKRKWAGTRQFRRGRIPLLVGTLAFAITLATIAYYAAYPSALPIVFWRPPWLTAAALAGGLVVIAGVPLALVWYFRQARGVDPALPSLWLAIGATVLASVLLLYDDFDIDRMLTGRVLRRDDYLLPAGLLAFAAAAGLLWRNRIDLWLQKQRWRLGRRLKLAYAPSLVFLLILASVAVRATGSSQLPEMSIKTTDPVAALLQKAEEHAARGENHEKDALAAIEEARRLNPSDVRIDATRESLAKAILAEFDRVPLAPDSPFNPVRGVQLRHIIDRAKRFQPTWPGIAQAEAMLAALRAKAWSGHPDCEGCPELVIIPPGNLLLGSPPQEAGRDSHEGPQFRVAIEKPFLIGRYEVTRAQFAKYIEEAAPPSTAEECAVWKPFDQTFEADKARTWREPGFDQTDDHPAVCANWLDAVGFLEWLSRKTGKRYRLPSEAEWEYAVRATTTAPYSTRGVVRFAPVAGDRPYTPPAPATGWYRNRTDPGLATYWRPGTQPVGSAYPENAFRLNQMHGNVAEWVLDCWIADYRLAATDGRPRSGESFSCDRVIRGGSWAGTEADARSAARRFAPMGARRNDLGFRVARELD